MDTLWGQAKEVGRTNKRDGTIEVLAEVHRVLRSGEAYVFSSRHLATAPSAPWLWPTFVFDSNLY